MLFLALAFAFFAFLALLELIVTKAEDDFDVELIVVLLFEPPHDGSPPYKEQIACLVTPTFDDGVSYCYSGICGLFTILFCYHNVSFAAHF